MSSFLSTEKSILKPISEGLAHCNGRVKISPNGAVLEVLYTSRPVFNWGGFEALKSVRHLSGRRNITGNEESRRRAYKKVFDYAACNEGVFDLFVTLTLDKQMVDRYDIKKIYPKLKTFLDNRVQRKGLAYILVPELHKDGAIHFHGLINSSAVKLKDSGKKYWKRNTPSYGQRIYNVTDWKLGFTTAVKLSGSYEDVCKYITKYVLKQSDGGLIGGRYYYHGGDLKTPHYEYINFMEQPEGKTYELEKAKLTVVYVTDLSNCRYEPADVRQLRERDLDGESQIGRIRADEQKTRQAGDCQGERVEICGANTTRPLTGSDLSCRILAPEHERGG